MFLSSTRSKECQEVEQRCVFTRKCCRSLTTVNERINDHVTNLELPNISSLKLSRVIIKEANHKKTPQNACSTFHFNRTRMTLADDEIGWWNVSEVHECITCGLSVSCEGTIGGWVLGKFPWKKAFAPSFFWKKSSPPLFLMLIILYSFRPIVEKGGTIIIVTSSTTQGSYWILWALIFVRQQFRSSVVITLYSPIYLHHRNRSIRLTLSLFHDPFLFLIKNCILGASKYMGISRAHYFCPYKMKVFQKCYWGRLMISVTWEGHQNIFVQCWQQQSVLKKCQYRQTLTKILRPQWQFWKIQTKALS